LSIGTEGDKNSFLPAVAFLFFCPEEDNEDEDEDDDEDDDEDWKDE